MRQPLLPYTQCLPSGDHLIGEAYDPGLAAAGDLGDIQRPHVTLYDMFDMRIDIEILPRIPHRNRSMGETMPAVTVKVIFMPVIKKIIVEHSAFQQGFLIGFQMEAPIDALAQAGHVAAVIECRDVAMLRETLHFTDPRVFQQFTQDEMEILRITGLYCFLSRLISSHYCVPLQC